MFYAVNIICLTTDISLPDCPKYYLVKNLIITAANMDNKGYKAQSCYQKPECDYVMTNFRLI
jgi:hypothetical protein